MQKIYSHPLVRHDDSSSIVRFARTVTKTVNVMKQLGYKADLEAETSLGSANRKVSHQLEDHWLKQLHDLKDYRPNLIMFQEWLEAISSRHQYLLARSNNSNFQGRKKPKIIPLLQTPTVPTNRRNLIVQ